MANNWNYLVVQASGREGEAEFGWDILGSIRSVGKSVAKGVNQVGKQIDKVPVVGKGLHAVYNVAASPVVLTSNIAAGHNVGKALVHNFKTQINAAKDLAPYVQTVVSMVPGIGTTASGVIAAATTIARGRPITEAVLNGVKGALPGGPVAAAAFDVAVNAAQGKPPSDVALAAIPGLSSEQKKALVAAVGATKDIMVGKPIDETLVNRAKQYLPPQAQQALVTGMAMAHAKSLQAAMEVGAKSAIPNLIEVGKVKFSTDPVAKAGAHTLQGEIKEGFALGQGMVSHKFSPTELNAIRNKVSGKMKEGLDIALSAHLGRLTKPLPVHTDPAVKFGFYATHGMKDAKKENRVEMKKALASNSKVMHGTLKAITQIDKESKLHTLGFWARLKYLLTGK